MRLVGVIADYYVEAARIGRNGEVVDGFVCYS